MAMMLFLFCLFFLKSRLGFFREEEAKRRRQKVSFYRFNFSLRWKKLESLLKKESKKNPQNPSGWPLRLRFPFSWSLMVFEPVTRLLLTRPLSSMWAVSVDDWCVCVLPPPLHSPPTVYCVPGCYLIPPAAFSPNRLFLFSKKPSPAV